MPDFTAYSGMNTIEAIRGRTHAHGPLQAPMPASQPRRIAFIDLDDTLLAPDKTISEANLAAQARLRSAGVEVAIASGRHHRNIAGRAAEIGEPGWTLSSHGSVVQHAVTAELLLEMTLPPELVEEISTRGRELGMSLIAYHREGAFIEARNEWIDLYARNAGWMPAVADFGALPAGGFQKILWSDHPARIQELLPAMRAEYAGRASVLETSPELLEFFSPRANKAVGAQALALSLGIPREDTLAFGDGTNDVELLAWAGVSVAMDHGREVARRAAGYVSPAGVPENAFARAVELALSRVPQEQPVRQAA
jgi:Cof subfamily protein (haloacid dehalogenase superfamily)